MQCQLSVTVARYRRGVSSHELRAHMNRAQLLVGTRTTCARGRFAGIKPASIASARKPSIAPTRANKRHLSIKHASLSQSFVRQRSVRRDALGHDETFGGAIPLSLRTLCIQRCSVPLQRDEKRDTRRFVAAISDRARAASHSPLIFLATPLYCATGIRRRSSMDSQLDVRAIRDRRNCLRMPSSLLAHRMSDLTAAPTIRFSHAA